MFPSCFRVMSSADSKCGRTKWTVKDIMTLPQLQTCYLAALIWMTAHELSTQSPGSWWGNNGHVSFSWPAIYFEFPRSLADLTWHIRDWESPGRLECADLWTFFLRTAEMMPWLMCLISDPGKRLQNSLLLRQESTGDSKSKKTSKWNWIWAWVK